jgi:integrase
MQQGSIIRSERKNGPAVWLFRWSETGPQGQRVYRKRVVGTVEEYATAQAIRDSVKGLIAKPRSCDLGMKFAAMTVAALCQHFQQRELALDDNWCSYSTRRNYIFLLDRWIIPRWGDYELSEIRTIEVESWLRSLARARSTCAKIRNLMSVLFNHAWRYELFDRNPISSFVRAPKGGPLPMSSSPPKSNCSWTISRFENGRSFSWRPQPVCAKVKCLRSSGVISTLPKAP